jgi:hypothetical protein
MVICSYPGRSGSKSLLESLSVSIARTSSALRTSTLIALGAFAVHQLRYLAAYGDGAGAALGAQGHTYLEAVLPLLGVLAALATLGTLAVAALGRGSKVASRGAGWAFCTAALLAIFGVQESAEAVLSAGHPGGLAALAGHGGWITLPIAVLVGRVVSLMLDGIASIERAVARTPSRRTPRAASTLGRARTAERRNLACRTLAFGLARRPPPFPAW